MSKGRAIALFFLLTFAATLVPVYKKGGNSLGVYCEGAKYLLQGKSPFDAPGLPNNTYKYSPAFAVVMIPFTAMPHPWQNFVWAALNLLVFWWGIFLWVRLKKDGYLIFWLVFCAMEVNGPIVHAQINPLLIGLILIGLDAFRKERWNASSSVLVTATNFKILPAIFLGPLLLIAPARFWLGCLLSTIVLFLLPLPWLGISFNWQVHSQWFHLLFFDATGTRMPGVGDFKALLDAIGLSFIAGPFTLLLGALSLAGVLSPVMTAVVLKKSRPFPWEPWIAFALASLMLLSPKTEGPTFVMLAPGVMLLALYLREQGRLSLALKIVLYVAAILITFLHNDVWPKFLFNPFTIAQGPIWKSTGALIVWLISLRVLVSDLQFSLDLLKNRSNLSTLD